MRRLARVQHWRERYSTALFALFVLGLTPLAQADGTAILLDLEGAIGVATAEYIIGGIEEAKCESLRGTWFLGDAD